MPQPHVSRRSFIRLALLGGIGAGVVYIQHQMAGVGVMNFLRWNLRGGLQVACCDRRIGEMRFIRDDLVSKLRNLWSIAELPNVKGKTILVKANLLDQIDDNLATTSPKVLGAILDLLTQMDVGKVVVGDGSAFRRDTCSVAESSGLSQEWDHAA
jgi:hypothetical protein